MVVAIDGPAGVGKSSVAAFIADRFSFFNLNSGSFYRAMVLKVLKEGIDPEDEKAVIETASTADLEIVEGRLHLDGCDVEDSLRTDAIDRWSSIISTLVPVRHIVNEHLRRIAGSIDLVAEGRDMTTVVFPQAEVKIFLDASPRVRAGRRFAQGTSQLSLDELEAAILERDHRDRNKEEGALVIAADALVIDTSALTLKDVYETVTGLIFNHLKSRSQE